MPSRLSSLLRRRPLRIAVSVALSCALVALLIATIHFTRFDLQWLAFLGGVLFAAVLALVSQASKAEWQLLRRTRQIERMREHLNEEAARSRNAAQGLRAMEARLRLIADNLPLPVLYADTDQRCRYHNAASREWLGLPAERLDGQLLQDVFGAEAYAAIAPHAAAALGGGFPVYEIPGANQRPPMQARHLPYAPEGGAPAGFYLLLTRRGTAAVAPAPAVRPEPAAAAGSRRPRPGQMAVELMDGIDPRLRLADALRCDEFLLFAQKVLPLKGGMAEPECFEVLLRLKEEEDLLLPPGGFIPVAEHYGMMEEIDRWVVRSLLEWAMARVAEASGRRVPLFFVNLSEAALANPGFPAFVRSELARTAFPARGLCFEVSEPDAIRSIDAVERIMTELRPAGCRFSIDDFGSARVSFSYLAGIRVDFLKIDGSIIHNILRDPAEFEKARAIHAACERAGTRTVAKFVETRETLGRLREIGIDYVQGFGIARPQPLGEALWGETATARN